MRRQARQPNRLLAGARKDVVRPVSKSALVLLPVLAVALVVASLRFVNSDAGQQVVDPSLNVEGLDLRATSGGPELLGSPMGYWSRSAQPLHMRTEERDAQERHGRQGGQPTGGAGQVGEVISLEICFEAEDGSRVAGVTALVVPPGPLPDGLGWEEPACCYNSSSPWKQYTLSDDYLSLASTISSDGDGLAAIQLESAWFAAEARRMDSSLRVKSGLRWPLLVASREGFAIEYRPITAIDVESRLRQPPSPLVVTVSSEMRVQGRVVTRAGDGSSTPLSGVDVSLPRVISHHGACVHTAERPMFHAPGMFKARTQSDGLFLIRGLERGLYELRLESPDSRPRTIRVDGAGGAVADIGDQVLVGAPVARGRLMASEGQGLDEGEVFFLTRPLSAVGDGHVSRLLLPQHDSIHAEIKMVETLAANRDLRVQVGVVRTGGVFELLLPDWGAGSGVIYLRAEGFEPIRVPSSVFNDSSSSGGASIALDPLRVARLELETASPVVRRSPSFGIRATRLFGERSGYSFGDTPLKVIQSAESREVDGVWLSEFEVVGVGPGRTCVDLIPNADGGLASSFTFGPGDGLEWRAALR